MLLNGGAQGELNHVNFKNAFSIYSWLNRRSACEYDGPTM